MVLLTKIGLTGFEPTYFSSTPSHSIPVSYYNFVDVFGYTIKQQKQTWGFQIIYFFINNCEKVNNQFAK